MQRKAKEYISRKIDIGKNFLHMTLLAQKEPGELKMGLHEIKKFIQKIRSRENSEPKEWEKIFPSCTKDELISTMQKELRQLSTQTTNRQIATESFLQRNRAG